MYSIIGKVSKRGDDYISFYLNLLRLREEEVK